MTTLSPRVQNDKPTIYALTDPVEPFAWKRVFYIGMSINILYRFQQHLYCNDSNQEKCEHIQKLLAEDAYPLLYKLEETESFEQGRGREQYWIRYAIEQGANLTNRAITATEQEITERHQERAVVYAKIAELLEQGIYVKELGYRYPQRLVAPYLGEKPISILTAFTNFFEVPGGCRVNVEDAKDEEFDAFIRQYLTVENFGTERWFLEDRCQAINFACFHKILDIEGA